MIINKAIRGRQHVMAMFEGIMLTHPDFCCIPKSSRVVREWPAVIGGPSLTGGVPIKCSCGSSNSSGGSGGGGSGGGGGCSSSSSSSSGSSCGTSSSSSKGSSSSNISTTSSCNSTDSESKSTHTMIISPATEIEIEPEGVESGTMGLPRCIMYKCFFTGKQVIISSSAAARNDDIFIIVKLNPLSAFPPPSLPPPNVPSHHR